MDVRVNFGAMQQGVSDIQVRYNAINQKLEDLKNYLAPMRATWDGSAREAYDAKQVQWDQAADGLQGVLQTLGTGLNAAHDDFHSGETRNTNMWA
jgi:WXG100 family type VII secretion target